MEYQAKVGKCKTGDYVLVGTLDYMGRSVSYNIGKLLEDGYVYLPAYHKYTTEPLKGARRKIGSEGCPLCRVASSEVDAETKDLIKLSIKLHREHEKQSPRFFEIRLIEKDFINRKKKVTICKSKTKTLPKNAEHNLIALYVWDTFRKRHFISSIYEQNCIDATTRQYKRISSASIDFKELTEAQYKKHSSYDVEISELEE